MKILSIVTASAAAAILPATSIRAQADGLFDDLAHAGRYEVEDEDRFWNFGAGLDATFFFKNNEYFSPHIEGYTLVGYQVRPTLTYALLPDLTLTAGLQALRYGGTSSATYVRPHFAVKWQATEWLGVQAGSLPGLASHPQHEAIQDPEGQLTEKPEFGVQLWISRPRLRSSVWLNWRKFIFMGDTVPERFTAGVSLTLGSWSRSGSCFFSMPVSLAFDHIGGQISDYPDTMQSVANVGLSPTLNVERDHWRFVQRLSFSLHVLGFHAMAGSEVRPFSDGVAISPEARLTAKYLQANLAWYHANDFYAPHGNPLFSSVSNFDPAYYACKRDLVAFGASFVKALGGIGRFAFDAKGYFDARASRLDYSYGFTFVLTPGLCRAHAPFRREYGAKAEEK